MCKELLKLNSKKTNEFKKGRKNLNKLHLDVLQLANNQFEKMLYFISLQGIANQNHNEIV